MDAKSPESFPVTTVTVSASVNRLEGSSLLLQLTASESRMLGREGGLWWVKPGSSGFYSCDYRQNKMTQSDLDALMTAVWHPSSEGRVLPVS